MANTEQSPIDDMGGEEELKRLYYLAGRFITKRITREELDEIAAMSEGDEEYSETFVVLTSTSYLTHFFRGMDERIDLPDLYK